MSCKTCGGTGTIGFYENESPLGSGQNWPMYKEDFCPDCVEKDMCPKCGKKGEWADGTFRCAKCKLEVEA